MKITASKNIDAIREAAIADINHLYDAWLEVTMPSPNRMAIYKEKYYNAILSKTVGGEHVNFPAYLASSDDAEAIIDNWESLHNILSQAENKRLYIINRIRESTSETKIKELIKEFKSATA